MTLEQEDIHERFLALGSDPWTVVYASWRELNVGNGGVYVALAPPTQRSEAVRAPEWNLSMRAHGPGFSQTYDGESWVTKYEKGYDEGGFEPLILLRNYHGVVPEVLEVVEEFRLYHNLYWDEHTRQFMKPHDDGTSSAAVKMATDRVEINTKLIRQYQAARQLDLILFMDSVRMSIDEPAPDTQVWKSETLHASRHSGRMSFGRGLNFSRYLATRVLPPPPIEKSGMWPYEEDDDYFPEFIIGVDSDGDDLRYTCNEAALANYFGANPDAPHYLTPVHFRRDVLQKYYENSELYVVSDGYLQCAGLWGIQIDNSAKESVVVFLGDLGRDLPRQERDYWRSYNIPPDAPVSETFIRRSFLGQSVKPTALDLQLRAEYISVGRAWAAKFGWDLFRKPEEADAGLLQRLRIPLNNSQAEFESSIRIMTQLFVDSLNESEIKKLLQVHHAERKGISKLEQWMVQSGYLHVERDIKFLRNLQNVRSKATAHRKGSDYESTLTKIFGEHRGVGAARMFFESALVLLVGLDEWLALQLNSD